MLHLILLTMMVAGQAPDVDWDNLVIPRKTDVFINLERSLSSRSASSGDRFHARLAVPITVDDRIVVPVGAYLIGSVDDTRKPGFFKGKGELYLTFDTIILPNGVTRKMVGVVQSAEGHRSGEGGEGKISATSSQSDEVVEGAKLGAGVGGIVGGASGGLKGFGVGTALGVATGAILGLIAKGENVELPRGASLTIQLEQDVRFVKPDEPPVGKPLKP